MTSSDAAVADGSDALDPRFEGLSLPQETRGLAGDAHARRRAGEDDVPGKEGQHGRQLGDQPGNAEDEITGTGILHLLAVDRASES